MQTRLATSIQPDGKRLEQMRLATGMSIYDVAAKLRTPPQAIAAAEASGWVGRNLVVALERLYTTGRSLDLVVGTNSTTARIIAGLPQRIPS